MTLCALPKTKPVGYTLQSTVLQSTDDDDDDDDQMMTVMMMMMMMMMKEYSIFATIIR